MSKRGAYSNLQTAINASSEGSTIKVKGTCRGQFSVAGNHGLTITSKMKSGAPMGTLDGNRGGTALSISGGSTVVITNLTVTGGSASGIVVTSGSSLTLGAGSVVSGNTVVDKGAGIANSGTLMLIGNASVTNNTQTAPATGNANGGGGVYNWGTLTMSGTSSVTHNTANYSYGGGIVNFTGTVNLQENSSLTDNVATGGTGGGIYNYNPPSTINQVCTAVITRNTALSGGGIYNDLGPMNLCETSITGNSATNYPDIRW